MSEQRLVLYMIEDCHGQRWFEWLYDYQAESYEEMGYIVQVAREKVR